MINQRVDAEKPFLGLSNFEGKHITTRDIAIAKNYLSEDELKQLNLIVSMYLYFAKSYWNISSFFMSTDY